MERPEFLDFNVKFFIVLLGMRGWVRGSIVFRACLSVLCYHSVLLLMIIMADEG